MRIMRIMNEESYFSPSEVYYSDLAELSARESRNDELRISELALIADDAARVSAELYSEGLSPCEIACAISGGDVFDAPLVSDVMEANRTYIERLSSLRSVADKAEFSKLYLEACKKRGLVICSRDFFAAEDTDETFTYVKNPLSDEAYDVLSQDFADPRVYYADSFKDACSSVAEGKTGYCILPFEEKGGSRISSISEMIYKHQLKVTALTPVFGFEGNADMKYALVCRSVIIPELSEDDDGYAELMLPRGSGTVLTELLVAAHMLSLLPYKVATVSVGSEDGERDYYSVILKDDEAALDRLTVFLCLFYPECEIFGIYKNLE